MLANTTPSLRGPKLPNVFLTVLNHVCQDYTISWGSKGGRPGQVAGAGWPGQVATRLGAPKPQKQAHPLEMPSRTPTFSKSKTKSQHPCYPPGKVPGTPVTRQAGCQASLSPARQGARHLLLPSRRRRASYSHLVAILVPSIFPLLFRCLYGLILVSFSFLIPPALGLRWFSMVWYLLRNPFPSSLGEGFTPPPTPYPGHETLGLSRGWSVLLRLLWTSRCSSFLHRFSMPFWVDLGSVFPPNLASKAHQNRSKIDVQSVSLFACVF